MGGPMEGLRQLAAALKSFDVEIEAVTWDLPDAAFLAKTPFKVHAMGPAKPGTFGYCPKMAQWIGDHGAEFDRIVVNGLWQYNGVAVWKTRSKHRRPYFVFCHGMMDSWFRRRYPLKHLKKQLFWWVSQGKVLRDAEKVLFTSQEERVQSHNGFWPYRLHEQVVQYGTAGLPVLATSAEPLFERFPALKARRLLLFLGRIHVKKGCDLLIRAFGKVAQEHPDVDLVMAGPDHTNWRPELEKLAQEANVTGRVHWIGMVSGDAKWETFLAAEAFVLPSHQENFGIAVAEALSAGLPVLISDKINIWREIDGEKAGLIEADDQEGTDRLLQSWLSMSAKGRAEMKENARPCFEKHFEVGKAARKLLEVYGLDDRIQEGK